MKWFGRILTLLGVLAVGGCLLLTLLYVRSPRSDSVPAPDAELTQRYSDAVTNAVSRSLEGLTHIRKIYRIPEGAPAPAPNPEGYGSSADPAEVRAVIDAAAELLDGQSITGWSEDTVLKEGSAVHWYRDESILALVWQEIREGTVCTFCEVKIADASQLRRKVSGDYYGSGILKTASRLAAEDNAVAAINGDFYAFRANGIRVWEGQLQLAHGWEIDSCFFTDEGDMLFARRGDITSWNAAKAFIEENSIDFSVTFGPILVEEGKNVTPWQYPLGEINEPYSRSVIGQTDTLHYLLMTSNFEPGHIRAVLAGTAADLMIEKGCHSAYSLDGGQTATLHLGGKLMCIPDFGWEREVSDIICFASAIPEGGVS